MCEEAVLVHVGMCVFTIQFSNSFLFTKVHQRSQSKTNLVVVYSGVKTKGVREVPRAYVHNIPRTGCAPSTWSLRLEARRENLTVCQVSSATFVPARRFWNVNIKKY